MMIGQDPTTSINIHHRMFALIRMAALTVRDDTMSQDFYRMHSTTLKMKVVFPCHTMDSMSWTVSKKLKTVNAGNGVIV